jgi:hypothetical protein
LSTEQFSFTGSDGTEVEVDITPRLKAFIEDTYESGYDPEKVIKDQAQANLLLPESALPKVQEFVHLEPDMEQHRLKDHLINMILDSKNGGVVVFDFQSEAWIRTSENVMAQMKTWMRERGVTVRLTPRMMESVQALQQRLQRERIALGK